MIKTIKFRIDIAPMSLQFCGKRMFIVGNRPRFFKNKKAAIYSNAIAMIAAAHRPNPAITGPVRLNIEMHMPRTQRMRDNDSIMHFKRPDRDNMLKGIQDALSSFWIDDGQVYDGRTTKLYCLPGEQPHINIEISYGFLD